MDFISIKNNSALPLASVPELDYHTFFEVNTRLMRGDPGRHCATLHGIPEKERVRLLCAIADDATGEIHLSTSVVSRDQVLRSMAGEVPACERFEREIHENFGISYTGHPWLKQYGIRLTGPTGHRRSPAILFTAWKAMNFMR